MVTVVVVMGNFDSNSEQEPLKKHPQQVAGLSQESDLKLRKQENSKYCFIIKALSALEMTNDSSPDSK